MDLIELDYLSALEDLTFNSKPIIHTLTYVAQENEAYALSVVNALEKHIQKCPPSSKLPALYLLDSISKNIGYPYTLFFGRHLFTTFMNAYTVVEPSLRLKLDQLLGTWKQRSPNSSSPDSVFPPTVTGKIENALLKYKSSFLRHQTPLLSATTNPTYPNTNVRNSYGSTYSGSTPADISGSGIPTPVNQVLTLENLLADVARMIITEQARCMRNPFDSLAKKRVEILSQLQQVLSTSSLPYDQLLVIKKQLTSLETPKPSPQPLASPFINPQPISTFPATQTPPLLSHASHNLAPTSYTSTPILPPQSAYPYRAPVPNASVSPPPPASSVFGPGNPASNLTREESESINSLFANLQAAGLVSPKGSPPPTVNAPSSFTSPISEIDLSKASLSTPHPELATLLYNSFPNQCANCGRRYANDPESRKELDQHFDWHFRINKRIRESSLHGINRCWFITEEEWIQNDEKEDLVTETAAELEEQKQKQLESILSQYVLTPLDPIIASQPCPVCQEKFRSVWHEEAEMWVFMNAVEKDGRICHATCLQELEQSKDAKISSNSAATSHMQPSSQKPVKQTANGAPPQADVQSLLQGIDVQGILQAIGKRKERDESVDTTPPKAVKQETE
ncbi:mRNA cleavage and polyadenylation factor complex RNA-binding subunit Pcf11 [Schizosaccharomyces osmophilus]|uniref:mRNA cleavage and polyadenylation factor complex RNA-binding subunit Pcf11 n=1 Tax=Schizosaccharomyces osmophilus TaxID=2545709 RepID=A0AAE9WCB1_9SCHI|nr:mRNA cleavage and polyadenylation factor complex RNA-binding subunit Pcf11 [Schizosaccharomyces osmophilus]WBW73691.1 mRNA cleavage and polyadenylation factor complex RNA-binding subunit Pcf11 [Schizosaccharomyces osmophilus]